MRLSIVEVSEEEESYIQVKNANKKESEGLNLKEKCDSVRKKN